MVAGEPTGLSLQFMGGAVRRRTQHLLSLRPRVSPSSRFLVGILAVALFAPACSDDGRDMRLPRPDQTESIITTTSKPTDVTSFDVSSLPALESDQLEISVPWSADGVIPGRFTCAGENISPDVAWFDVTPAAMSMAIVFYEESLDRTVHWIVANLDPTTAYLPAGAVPPDALIGANDPVPGDSTIGYRGPCLGPGETRSYTIEVHALGQFLDLPSGTPAQNLIEAIDMASLQMASVTGTVTG